MHTLRNLLVLAALAGSVRTASAQFAPPQLLPGDLTAFPSAGDQRHAQIARGSGQSLMVWEDTRSGLTGTVSTGGNPQPNFDLCAARLDDSGNLLDTTALVLRSAPFSQTEPKVAWNGQNYLVVWSERVVHPFNSDMGVYAMRVSPAGQVLDDPPILLEDRTYVEDTDPCVASDGSGWVVMWSGLSDNNNNAVRGCTVAANGTAGVLQTLLASASGFYFPVNFEVAYSAGRYLFVSEHFPQGGSGNHVFGQLFDTSLAKLGAQFDIGPGTGSGTNPTVAGNGTGFAVAWNTSADIRATPVSTTGVSAVPGGVAVSGGAYVTYQLPSLTWDGSNWLIAFTSSVQAVYGLRAARVDAAGVLLGGAPIVVESGPWQMELATCVQTAAGSLVVWSDARNAISNYNADRTDLYGAPISAGGTPGASACYSISPPAQTDPAIAGDAAHGFLVGCLAQTASTAAIQVQRVDASGAALDAQPIVLQSGVRTLLHPSVAWNGSVWLVTWEQIANGPFAPAPSIVGMRVAPNGSVLDATPIPIMPGNTPEAAAVGDEFLVVGTYEPVNHVRSVYTRRVRGSDGALLDPTPNQLSGSYDAQVTVAAFADRWIVAWAHLVTHDAPYATLRFSVLPVGGSPTPYQIGGDAGFTNNGPRLATDGAQAMLTWYANGDIYARRILADGTKLDSDAGILVSGANNAQFTPSIAWTGADFLVAYDDYRLHTSLLEPGLGDVYATHVLASGAVVEPAGIAIANAPLLPEGQPAVGGDQGLGLIAYSSLEAGAPLGTWRIALRGETQSVATYCTAKVNSLGCTPAIGWSGTPSASAGSGFVVRATNVLNNKNGLFFYGLAGQQSVAFQGGVLCVKLPIRRTAVQGSGGNPPPNDCSGAFALDFNAFIAGGTDPALVQGVAFDGQYWSRDPGFAPPNNVGLTNALHAVIGP